MTLSHFFDNESKKFRINSLPGTINFNQTHQFSGYIKADNTTSLFFWLVKPISRTLKAPQDLVIWLNGGPGCSSMDGNFMEIGLYRFNKDDGNLEWNPYSWSLRPNVHILYVDQPGSTGFSKSLNPNMPTSTAIENFYTFYTNFLASFPEYNNQINNRLFITGESYAGVYIPYYSKYLTSKGVKISGIAIGNGWMHPKVQYPSLFKYIKKYNLVPEKFHPDMQIIEETCLQEIQNENDVFQFVSGCENVFELLWNVANETLTDCVNIYSTNLRSPDCGTEWPMPDLKMTTDYLNEYQVRKEIGVEAMDWAECRANIIDDSTTKPSYSILPELLEQGVGVLLYAGDYDLICNYIGIEDMLQSMFPTRFKERLVEKRELHEIHDYGQGLVYMRIYNASHMVPYDNREGGLSVIDTLRDRANIISVEREKEQVTRTGLLIGLSVTAFVSILAMAMFLYYKRRKRRMFIQTQVFSGDREKGKTMSLDDGQYSPIPSKEINRPFSPEEMNDRFIHEN